MDENGLINILTVIPVDEIETKGIEYIKSKFNPGIYGKHFDNFWIYFKKTWLGLYDPSTWNINAILASENVNDILINRTNNPLERFNRELNQNFPVSHPSMAQFVDTIKKISKEKLKLYNAVAKGKAKPPAHEAVKIHAIPADYAHFKILKL